MGETNTEYGADQIQILEGLEAVRKRPGMYIGSTSSRGLHHLVYEIVDNAVDEALAGYCTEINVAINPDNSITVVDNGRGIPVGINHKAGIPAVEVVHPLLMHFLNGLKYQSAEMERDMSSVTSVVRQCIRLRKLENVVILPELLLLSSRTSRYSRRLYTITIS